MFDKKKYMKEYYQRNKEYIKINQRKRNESNSEYMRIWREKNREHIIEYYQKNKKHIKNNTKEWREKNKDHCKKYNKKYYQENKEKEVIRKKKWREMNPDYHKKYGNKYYQDNIENYREYGKKRYKNNPDYLKQWQKINFKKVKQTKRKYFKTERGKVSIQRGKFRRQTRERNAINTLTAKEWLEILKKYNYECAYCGIEFDENNLPEKEHITPISKGGDNIKENIIPACRSCNAKKYNKILI